jgi:hypothetical protein
MKYIELGNDKICAIYTFKGVDLGCKFMWKEKVDLKPRLSEEDFKEGRTRYFQFKD